VPPNGYAAQVIEPRRQASEPRTFLLLRDTIRPQVLRIVRPALIGVLPLWLVAAESADPGSPALPPATAAHQDSTLPDWLGTRLPGALHRLGNTRVDLTLAAESLQATEAVALSQPTLRLQRSPASDSSHPAATRFTATVAVVSYLGVQLSEVQATGEISGDRAWTEGGARLDNEPFRFRFDLAPTNASSSGLESASAFTGAFAIRDLRFRDFATPSELAAGASFRISGALDLTGHYRLSPGKRLDLQPELDLAVERIEWLEQKLTVEGVQGRLSGKWPAPANTPTDRGLRIDRVRYGDYEVSDMRWRVARLDERQLELELETARWLEGTVRVPAFRWELGSDRLDAAAELEQVSLARLAELVPRFGGSIEGALNGRVPIRIAGGRLSVGEATLRLERSRPARLRYPADGLLTKDVPPGSERYRQLELIEHALADLRLTELIIQLHSPDHPETPVRLRLEGTFSSADAVIPVNFNLNLTGDVDQVLELLSRGDLEFSL
jgi:hypothetical protein